MKCESYRAEFPEAYYGELAPDAKEAFDRHLADCGSCRAAYEDMSETLRVMSLRELPEPSKEFEASLFESVRSELGLDVAPNRKPNIVRFPSVAVPRWAYGVAAMLLIALGVYIGRMMPGPEIVAPSNVASNAAPAAPIAAPGESEVQNYLDRSRSLLLGVVNGDNQSPELLARQQAVSRELARKAVFLKAGLKSGNDQALRKLIGDLEVVLLQLANYSNETGIPVVELVRQGVDKKSLLLKINIEQIRALTTHGTAPAQPKQTARKHGT